MKEISYESPGSVAEAVTLLNGANGAAKVLAGGTDILVQLREGLRDAEVVVDVKRIPELMEIRQLSSGGWFVGAAVPCDRLERHAEFAKSYPAVADAIHIIGGWQIKCRASLGGNLCTSSPAGDSLPALIAHSAVVQIVGPGGERKVPVEEFCTSPGKNILTSGDLVVGFEFPAPAANSSGCYIRFIPRYEMDIAVVGAGAWLTVEGGKVTAARIGLGAVAPTPLLAEDASQSLIGKPANDESFAAAGDLARKIAKPISDMRGPAEYRVHLAGVLVKRALSMANRRIQGETVHPLKDGHF